MNSNNMKSTVFSDTSNLDWSGSLFSVDELSEIEEIEKTAEIEAVANYSAREDLLDTAVSERGHLYSLFLSRRGSWARFIRKKLGSRTSP